MFMIMISILHIFHAIRERFDWPREHNGRFIIECSFRTTANVVLTTITRTHLVATIQHRKNIALSSCRYIIDEGMCVECWE